MPTPKELLERLASRGEPRGAGAVYAAANAPRTPPRLLAAAAVVLTVVAAATIVVRNPDSSTETIAAPSSTTSTTIGQTGRLGAGGPLSTTSTTSDAPPDTTPDDVTAQGTGEPVVVRLEAHDSCDAVLARLVERGLEAVGPYGLDNGDYRVAVTPAAEDSASEPQGASTTRDAAQHSTSNVQEEGIDEPDLLKTDGRVIVAAARGRLQIVGVDGPSLLASLEVGISPSSLFLVADTVVVIGEVDHSNENGLETPVVLVDLTEPSDPTITSTTRFEGVVRTARLQSDVVRLVLADSPRFEWSHPEDGSEDAQARAEEQNRAMIESSTLDAWLPGYRTTGPDGSTIASGQASGCTTSYTATEESGFDTTTIVTLNPGTGTVFSGTSVSASPHVVYANDRSLYIVTSASDEDGRGPRSDIHRFDLTSPTAAPYRASGQVPGLPINQFALSERDAHLRIATTMFDWRASPRESVTDDPDFAAPSETESAMWVLGEQDDDLVLVGEVRGLGEEGETIHSVRYEGSFAYVTTFRRTDPLYVIDLTDPTAPRVRGELHIPGFSTFLQHVGSDRLLGVGRDADEDGRVQGLQLSRFDVSNPLAPTRDATLTYDRAMSLAEHDHLAFLHWAPQDLVVVPLVEWDGSGCAPFSGALLVDITDGLEEIGRVTHAGHGIEGDAESEVVPIVRSAIVGPDLVTLSPLGLAFGDPTDGTERSFVLFEGDEERYVERSCTPREEPEPQPEPDPEPDPDDDDGLLGL